MPKIIPFCATRYIKKDISDFICPPYDVISENEKKLLMEKSPYNAVRIELPENYISARQNFNLWKSKEVLILDTKPAFYLYEQSFYVKNKKWTRTGFFCLIKTERFGKNIFPHEKTHLNPKIDRLNLLRTTKINTSPIFCLFSDSRDVFKKIAEKTKNQKPMTFSKSSEISEKMWVIQDKKTIISLKNLLKNNKILIADGHHRYETFYEFTHGKNILSFLCSFEDKGLLILPTHRLLKKWRDRDTRDLCRLVKFGKKRWDFRFYIKNIFINLSCPRKFSGLPVQYLHSTILKDKEVEYTKDENEAVKKVAQRKFSAAIILKPLRINELKLVVKNKILLPQKSTYFYPKVSTGVVFNEITAWK